MVDSAQKLLATLEAFGDRVDTMAMVHIPPHRQQQFLIRRRASNLTWYIENTQKTAERERLFWLAAVFHLEKQTVPMVAPSLQAQTDGVPLASPPPKMRRRTSRIAAMGRKRRALQQNAPSPQPEARQQIPHTDQIPNKQQRTNSPTTDETPVPPPGTENKSPPQPTNVHSDIPEADNSLISLTDAIDRDPTDDAIWAARSSLHASNGHVSKAISDALRALDIATDKQHHLQSLHRLYQKAGLAIRAEAIAAQMAKNPHE